MKERKIKIHVPIPYDIYVKLWELIKKRYISPTKKLHIVITEALKEYLERHKDELEE